MRGAGPHHAGGPGRTVVERVVRVRLVKQVNDTVYYSREVEDGLPVFAQDVQADFAVEVDVGVVNLVRGPDTARSVSGGRGRRC